MVFYGWVQGRGPNTAGRSLAFNVPGHLPLSTERTCVAVRFLAFLRFARFLQNARNLTLAVFRRARKKFDENARRKKFDGYDHAVQFTSKAGDS